MKKLLLFTMILLILYCDNKSKDKVYLPKMKFKRTQNPNYSNYFPDAQDTISKNTQKLKSPYNKNVEEPLLSFNSQPISNSTKNKENITGFFASLFDRFEPKNKNSEERICAELLDNNNTALKKQNGELTSLKSDKKKLLDEINNIEKKYQRQKTQEKKENHLLESEINRLNRLIKILSTELK